MPNQKIPFGSSSFEPVEKRRSRTILDKLSPNGGKMI